MMSVLVWGPWLHFCLCFWSKELSLIILVGSLIPCMNPILCIPKCFAGVSMGKILTPPMTYLTDDRISLRQDRFILTAGTGCGWWWHCMSAKKELVRRLAWLQPLGAQPQWLSSPKAHSPSKTASIARNQVFKHTRLRATFSSQTTAWSSSQKRISSLMESWNPGYKGCGFTLRSSSCVDDAQPILELRYYSLVQFIFRW